MLDAGALNLRRRARGYALYPRTYIRQCTGIDRVFNESYGHNGTMGAFEGVSLLQRESVPPFSASAATSLHITTSNFEIQHHRPPPSAFLSLPTTKTTTINNIVV